MTPSHEPMHAQNFENERKNIMKSANFFFVVQKEDALAKIEPQLKVKK